MLNSTEGLIGDGGTASVDGWGFIDWTDDTGFIEGMSAINDDIPTL